LSEEKDKKDKREYGKQGEEKVASGRSPYHSMEKQKMNCIHLGSGECILSPEPEKDQEMKDRDATKNMQEQVGNVNHMNDVSSPPGIQYEGDVLEGTVKFDLFMPVPGVRDEGVRDV